MDTSLKLSIQGAVSEAVASVGELDALLASDAEGGTRRDEARQGLERSAAAYSLDCDVVLGHGGPGSKGALATTIPEAPARGSAAVARAAS